MLSGSTTQPTPSPAPTKTYRDVLLTQQTQHSTDCTVLSDLSLQDDIDRTAKQILVQVHSDEMQNKSLSNQPSITLYILTTYLYSDAFLSHFNPSLGDFTSRLVLYCFFYTSLASSTKR